MNTQNSNRRCGFVAVIGAPNAGKSTLINRMVGSKVTIVSPKVQTTRALVRGIAQHENSQIIFIDTPGIFQPKKRLEKAIVSAAWEGQADADVIMLVVDASRGPIDRETLSIIKKLEKQDNKDKPVLLVLNKIDKIEPQKLLSLSQALNERLSFTATYMISALKGDGTKNLLNAFAAYLPEGPWMYPEDQASDMPMILLAAEITREKLFHRLQQELPYALTVETEDWENFEDGSIKISQVIYVARPGHKAIILGKGGSMIKAVGEAARIELENMLGVRVHLKLFVKLREKWTDDPERYSLWGLDYNA